MNLFDIVPDRFFSVLSSKNKVLYTEALFILRDLRKEDMSIHKDELIGRISARLEYLLDSSTLDEEESAYGDAGSTREKANVVFQVLKDRGWLESEYLADNSFEEMINIPDYAYEVIDVLYRLVHQQHAEYKGYVYSTYASLMQLKEQPEYSYTALLEAYNRTNEFEDAIGKLFSNIRRYHNKISSLDVNGLLEDHFMRYQQDVMKIIDPIRTNDSVPRFKGRILEVVEGWRESEEFIAMLTRQGMASGRYESEEDCLTDVLSMLDYIIRTYHSIERVIHRVEDKHSAYTNASVERIRYKLNSGSDLQGIIARLVSATADEAVTDGLSSALRLSLTQSYAPSSLYKRRERSIKDKDDALPFERSVPSEDAEKSFLESIREMFPSSRIDEYVMTNLEDGRSSSEDFSLETSDEYVLLLLSVLRAGENGAPFTIEFDADKRVERDRYSIPMIRYSRKEIE